ncbi:hypothetical protein [Streptomyces sp. NPDC050504]|uniref:hypothetical protein n=1 Tax=Streptomyces sp. NPDC050504 TaxID=3365618 RepID=UPI0037B34C65
MTRRRHRTTRARACTGKHAHRDRAAALAQIASLRRMDGAVRMAPYRCPYCRHWHVGHLPGSRH